MALARLLLLCCGRRCRRWRRYREIGVLSGGSCGLVALELRSAARGGAWEERVTTRHAETRR
jgi:hypothetical protein